MIAQNEEMLVAFVNSNQPPLKTKHLCYFTQDNGDEIDLMQVVEATYPHPEAEEIAVVFVTQVNLVKRVKRTDWRAAHLVLMGAQQKACRAMELK